MVGRWRQGRSSTKRHPAILRIARCPFAHDGPGGILHPDIRPTPHVRGCSSTGFDSVYPLMAAFGRAKLKFLKHFLKLKHGIPSHDTFSTVFRMLDPKALDGQSSQESTIRPF